MPQITLPDGSAKQIESGATPLDVAQSISGRLAQAALVAELDGQLVDLSTPITADAKLRILTERDPEALEVYRHSAAHLLAAATLELYPDVKLGVGPPIDNGFYYDMQREQPFTPEDLEKIEAKMQEIVDRDLPNRRVWMNRDEALALYRAQGELMKCELIADKTEQDAETVSIYKTGDQFNDFCRGPHIPSMGRIQAFKLLSVSGSYWKGNEKNQRLQRIYGTAFFSKKDLNKHLMQIEEAKKRDHRKLGRDSTCSRSRTPPDRGSSSGTRRAGSSARSSRTGCATSTSSAAMGWCSRRMSPSSTCGRRRGTRTSTPMTCSSRWRWTRLSISSSR